MTSAIRHLLGLLAFTALSACSAPAITADTSARYSRIHILGHYTLPREPFQGEAISELSGLAWDEDEQLLYAVSDRGRIFHFRLTLGDNGIQSVQPVFAAGLLDKQGKKLRARDSEGLSTRNANNGRRGDTQLVVSFEHGPRLLRMSPQGKELGSEPLNKALVDKKQYRDPNQMLESVVLHPKYGLLTAPERSLRGQPDNLQSVYSVQKSWSFMAYPATNSSVTGLEILPDESLLVLERAWSGFPNPMVISLRRVDLEACSQEGACKAQDLGVFSSILSVDNYEGLAHIKDNLYLMVSDDGQHDLLRTVLTLFRVE
ncbi:MAG: esterase-like activity of phytase family protein [Thiolinea sp.]